MTLCKLDSQIELVLAVQDQDGHREIYSIKQIEWRFLLVFGSINLNIEMQSFHDNSKLLSDYDQRSKVSVGIINIQMDLLPKTDQQLIPERVLNEQLSKEKKFKDLDTLRFYQYSQEWWNDYKQIQKSFDQRAVKIYAENEDGVYKPVCKFLYPLDNLRGIQSPYHAARFVSLIPLKRREKPGGEKIEIWHRFHTFLCNKEGDVEDHALLLCSLLLGFGLDAYVAVGSSSEGAHLWVVTVMKTQKNTKYTFWESLTGQRYDQKDPRVNGLYRKIGCVFNHKNLYANIQQNDMAIHTVLEFNDFSKWKRMDEKEIVNLSEFQAPLQLICPTLDSFLVEDQVEKKLKYFLTEYRLTNGLTTKFDDKLAYLLTTALSNYENERINGHTFGNEEFQYALKNYIPENHTFKAFPIQFLHKNINQIFATLRNSPICDDILQTRGDSIYFGIKSYVVVYPDDIFVLWISVAVRYHSID